MWHVDPSSQPNGETTAWKLSYAPQGGADTPCKDVYVARGQVVNVACGGGTAAAPACTNADGFKSVGVKRKGKGLRISFKRKVDAQRVTVAIYQTSKGRKINKKAKRVARFRNRKRALHLERAQDEREEDEGRARRVLRPLQHHRRQGKADVRRVVVAKGKNGRFVKKGKFILEHHC